MSNCAFSSLILKILTPPVKYAGVPAVSLRRAGARSIGVRSGSVGLFAVAEGRSAYLHAADLPKPGADSDPEGGGDPDVEFLESAGVVYDEVGQAERLGEL